jgi:hypothetical protein
MRGTSAATRLIIASSVGNALEFYEILVYGYFAVVISKVFFPAAYQACQFSLRLARSAFHFWRAPSARFFSVPMGSQRAQTSADTVDPSDDRWHRLDDGDAKLWFCRSIGADPRHRRAVVATGGAAGVALEISVVSKPPDDGRQTTD